MGVLQEAATRRTLDGNTVILSGALSPLRTDATNHLVVSLGSRTVEFESGQLDFVDDVASWMDVRS